MEPVGPAVPAEPAGPAAAGSLTENEPIKKFLDYPEPPMQSAMSMVLCRKRGF